MMENLLVPHPRRILADYYDRRPFSPLCKDVFRFSSKIQSLSSLLLTDSPASLQDEKLLIEETSDDPVYKIERNLWKNREHLEEILCLLDDSRWPPTMLRQSSTTPGDIEFARVLPKIADMLQKSLDKLVAFQDRIDERILSSVTTLLPRCVQRIVIRQHKDQKMNVKAKYDDLVTSETSIGARYALLWEQQMETRRKLIRVCFSIGFCQTSSDQNENSVRKVILDLYPTIDDDDWPMEEQAERYGPPLNRLTAMILSIRLFLLLLWRRYEASELKKDQVIVVLNQAVGAYTREFERFITFASEVFEGSSFFISADDIGSGIDDFKEATISGLKTHEVSLEVDAINSNIVWDFFLVVTGNFKTWDIEFSVECTDALGNKTIILPQKQCGADKGSFVATHTGNYKLIWDNSHQFMFTKFLLYKVKCIPPVVEPEPESENCNRKPSENEKQEEEEEEWEIISPPPNI